MDYLYDGSFEGLLSCIYHNYYREKADGIYLQELYQGSLTGSSSIVTSNPAQAARVSQAIEQKISGSSLLLVYKAFLSSYPGKENIILSYLRLGFRLGAKIDFYHSHPRVHPLHKIARRVAREAERFLGLLRFTGQGRFLYASLSPDHDILPLIADHFADRMANERWIIHDLKRNIAVIYDGQNPPEERRAPQRRWYLTGFDHQLDSSGPEEDRYRELWKLYFAGISIDSRRNPRLQTHFIPLRYRQHLPEFEPPRGR